eukprot:TRINITY_DN27038_c0_g1_i1.p2 TRINITY_DN27038_c0_g1~~TRINITY_DN27038_c0_g1_i1.p2  ORF type:complete len:130 (+),score=14.41 TRINITY_DN27038_c0_g1_i1:375-764(+)
MLTNGSSGAQLHKDMDFCPTTDLLVSKTRFGAFHNSSLDGLLRNRGITTILLTGVLTNACVLHTAIQAQDRGYDVILVKDAVAAKGYTEDYDVAAAEKVVQVVVDTFGAVTTSKHLKDALLLTSTQPKL